MNEAHVRIDEGVKRGPRKKRKDSRELRGLTPKPRPDDLGSWKIPATLDPDEVIGKYLTEATTTHIAASYGLSRRALVKWLREQRPKEWKEAQLIRAHEKLEIAEDGIENSDDALSLARPRELAKAMQFRITALDPDYRPKQEVMHTGEINLVSVLDGHCDRLLDRIGAAQRHVAPPLTQSNIIDVEETPK